MLAPQLTETEKQTMMTEVFLGYNHNLELADGEFYDMENLSADEYPLLAPRPRRGTAQAIEGVQGILAKDALCWVQDQVLYINGASMEAYMPSVSISAGEKQLISMGAYLCIFPDGIYFNTEKYSDNGYMGQENVVDASSTNVEISLCLVDGTALAVSYDNAVLEKLLGSMVYEGQSDCYIVRSNGDVVLSTETKTEIPEQMTNLFDYLQQNARVDKPYYDTMVQTLPQGGEGCVLYTLNRQKYYLIYQPLGILDWSIIGIVPTGVVDAGMRRVQNATILVIALLGLLIMAGVVKIQRDAERNRRRAAALGAEIRRSGA